MDYFPYDFVAYPSFGQVEMAGQARILCLDDFCSWILNGLLLLQLETLC